MSAERVAASVLLATRSVGKGRELLTLLAEAGITAETLRDAGIEETPEEAELEVHATFAENALAKALWFAERSGRVVVADDSGLCVDALDGRPGVYSKRWSGRSDLGGAALDAANNQHLLRELEEAAERGRPERTARYVCAVACAWPAAGTGALGQPIIVLGESVGTILSVPRGSGGFGYDPWFSSPALGGRTFAEISREEKALVSHRGVAFQAFLREAAARGLFEQVNQPPPSG